LPLFYHGQHSGTVFLSDHNFLPAKVGTIMPEKKMLVAVGILFFSIPVSCIIEISIAMTIKLPVL